jgi:hypothetical protein
VEIFQDIRIHVPAAGTIPQDGGISQFFLWIDRWVHRVIYIVDVTGGEYCHCHCAAKDGCPRHHNLFHIDK